MHRFLVALLVASLSLTSLSAKAGQSSSSRSTSVSSGTKAYSKPATTQYSSTAVKPTTAITPTTSTSTTSRPTQSTTTTSSPVASSTATTNNTTARTIERSSDSGIGIGGVIVGTAVGTMVGNSLSSHNQQAPVIINNGQPQPTQYQQAPQYAASAQTSAPVIATTQTNFDARTSSSWFSSIFSFVLTSMLVILVAFGIYKLYLFLRRKHTISKRSYEDNIPKLCGIYTNIQNYVSQNTIASKALLSPLCTAEMYHYLTTISSENADNGLANIVKNIKVLDCTTREVVEDESSIYHSVKIRSSFIDYTINAEGATVSGSETTPITDIEVWTFVSTDGGRTWLLSAIEQYVK